MLENERSVKNENHQVVLEQETTHGRFKRKTQVCLKAISFSVVTESQQVRCKSRAELA